MLSAKRLCAVFIAASALFVAGCGGSSTQSSTGEYIDDSTITTKVKTAIFNEPTLKVLQINVETYEGVVQLSGFVDNAASRTKAAEIARSVQGVKTVKNDLELR